MYKFDLPKNQSSIIKVIGVGGGGSNAVNHMYHQGIRGVDFIICNTDSQAMETSPVPVKIQLGANLTQGLGAGAVPAVGRNAALENEDEIRAVLEKGTKMLFITAGLGGGTGTGAAPVIANIARELNILTVAIVTIPFSFEGRKRTQYAEEGIADLKDHVDAVVIIRNDKLRELYGNLTLRAAFAHADNVLTTAAKGIAELITVAGYINVDFEDVKTVMKDSGVAIMGMGIAGGESRAALAIEQAMSSPLLSDDNVEGARNILLFITSGKDEIKMDEISEITDYIKAKTKSYTEVIWGNGYDESLEDKISVTIIATGFDEKHRSFAEPERKPDKIVHTLDGKVNIIRETPPPPPPVEMVPPQPLITDEIPEPESLLMEFHEPEISFPESAATEPFQEPIQEPVREPAEEQEEIKRTLIFDIRPAEKEEPVSAMEQPAADTSLFPDQDLPEPRPAAPMFQVIEQEPVSPDPISDADPEYTDPEKIQVDRKNKLKQLSEKLKSHPSLDTNLYEIESVPAYKRRNIPLSDVIPSAVSQAPNFTVSGNPENKDNQINENKFLHNKAD